MLHLTDHPLIAGLATILSMEHPLINGLRVNHLLTQYAYNRQTTLDPLNIMT